MRDLILGILMGGILAVIPNWMEKHKMDNYTDIVMIVCLSGIFLLLIWRPILRFIAKKNPRFYIWINELSSPPILDNDYREKAYTKKSKKNNNH
jgi:hypothetical protein